jgi:hypothetical protein
VRGSGKGYGTTTTAGATTCSPCGQRHYACELRFHGESYGWEAQFLEGGEFRCGWMFLLWAIRRTATAL